MLRFLSSFGSADQSDRPREAVAASWPQAASISTPLVTRIVAFTAERAQLVPKTPDAAGRGPDHGVPGRRVEWDEVDVRPERDGKGGQLGGIMRRSLTPSISAHSIERRRPLAST